MGCGSWPARPQPRLHRAGCVAQGGRKKLTETDPTLLADLQSLAEPTTRGDPMALLLWISRSLRNLTDALQVTGHRIKHNVVADLLRQLDYSLQSNRKTRERHRRRMTNCTSSHVIVRNLWGVGERSVSSDQGDYAPTASWPHNRRHRAYLCHQPLASLHRPLRDGDCPCRSGEIEATSADISSIVLMGDGSGDCFMP